MFPILSNSFLSPRQAPRCSQLQRQAHRAASRSAHQHGVFRLNRIRELTGIDPGSYSGLSLLLTTVRMLNAGAKSDTIRR
jgi:hypothetical protein